MLTVLRHLYRAGYNPSMQQSSARSSFAPQTVADLPDGVVVFDGGVAYFKSDSALAVLQRLDGIDVPVEVTIEPHANHEMWQRRFGRAGFTSVLALDAGTQQLTERFGPVRCTLKIECHVHGLDMSIDAARLLGLPLPRFLTPWTRAYERLDTQGRFTFDVEIGLPGIGRLVRYRGWLAARRPS